MLKLRIKESSVRYGVEQAMKRRCEISELEKELNNINEKYVLTDDDAMRKEVIQNKLHDHYVYATKGAQLRAKVDEVNEVESNRELFKGIESARQKRNLIECLRIGNEDVTDQNDILHAMGEFYCNLYSKSDAKLVCTMHKLRLLKV